jgi:hypothetical protein
MINASFEGAEDVAGRRLQITVDCPAREPAPLVIKSVTRP